MRALIKSHIIEAWKDCVENDYKNQRINSERSLQAALWAHLYNNNLPENMRLFIEPTIHLNGNEKIRPDIVVCNKKNIISIIEIKYIPRGNPKHEKDINSLAKISAQRENIYIENHRFQGIIKDKTKYKAPKSILFVWAGFHTKQKKANNVLFSIKHKELKGCYLQLQAETEMGLDPKIIINGKYEKL